MQRRQSEKPVSARANREERIATTKKKIPFEFVLDELGELPYWTRPMFGCTAIYIEEKIMLVLRYKPERSDASDGVWVATTREHHASLRQELPNLRSIAVLGTGETGWQMLAADAPDFEESVRLACALVRAGDPRIGKLPKAKKAKKQAVKRRQR
jgi:hypothetical protein